MLYHYFNWANSIRISSMLVATSFLEIMPKRQKKKTKQTNKILSPPTLIARISGSDGIDNFVYKEVERANT